MMRYPKTRFWVGRYGDSIMRYRRLLTLGAIVLSAALPLSFADQIVYFVNGKGIVVKSVEKGEKFTVLEMEGGGKVGVPTDQILRFEDVVAPTPPAAPVAPPQASSAPAPVQQQVTAAPVAAPAPAQAAAASAGPPVPSMIPGPGLGGRPVGGGLNEGLARATPLDVGGNSANPVAQQRPAPQTQPGPGQSGAGGQMLGRTAGGRPNLGDIRNRLAGRPGLGPGGRRAAMMNRAGTPASGAQTPPQAPGANQPPQAAAQPQAQPQATPAPEPPPAASVEPEDPPAADDANEQPSDPPAPEEGDSSGNSPGSAS
jgi:hypothetical protein